MALSITAHREYSAYALCVPGRDVRSPEYIYVCEAATNVFHSERVQPREHGSGLPMSEQNYVKMCQVTQEPSYEESNLISFMWLRKAELDQQS